ncbi:uncharacterized protein LOC119084287 [Bradysia coprophila]|uniref:uncharacterized protein LOC119084287 n=1 Tax=Bradysia coprophila TaxID=38358 RepID=UPI00187D7A63|nr:uncharacterized protein LOC119084287 [Bradysia coprophila]
MVNYNYGLYIAVNAGFGALRQTLQWHTLLMLGNNCGNDPTAELFICAATTSPSTQNEGGDSGGSYFIYENGPISGTPTIIGIHYGRAVWTNGTITNLATRIGPFMGLVSAQAGITLRP